jgi:hypothetical protein
MNKTNLANHLDIDPSSIKQEGSKQLFIVRRSNTLELYSYFTKVGEMVDGVWNLTTNKYSRTTSKQLTQFARDKKVIYTDNI